MTVDEWALPLPSQLAGWALEDHPIVDSTQPLAAARPAWTAVFAQEQRLGRGQRERTFVSNHGGLYVSAVLPYAGDPLRARGFSLAVGWALREALSAIGVSAVRLRWPNDLMRGARKLGGILVEQGKRDTLLVGVGLNVRNEPWSEDPALASIADSLERECERRFPRVMLAAQVLQAIRTAHEEFSAVGFVGLVESLNAAWGEPRSIVLEMVSGAEAVRGVFAGIAPSGHLRVVTAHGTILEVPEHHVARLREPGV